MKMTQEIRQRRTDYVRMYRHKRQALGLCYWNGCKERSVGRSYCRAHLEHHNRTHHAKTIAEVRAARAKLVAKILTTIKRDGRRMTVQDLATKHRVSWGTMFRWLDKLRKAGVVSRLNSNSKLGGWVVLS
jgi:ribosomal protein S25